MAKAVIMPRQGQSVESCIITEWHKQVGDRVQAGEKLFTYETDKSVFDEEAKESGTLLARFFDEDDDVPVLVNVAVIGGDGEDISGFAPEGHADDAGETEVPSEVVVVNIEAQEAAAHAPDASVIEHSEYGRDRHISPRARATAERMGINPQLAKASGPNGRIIERDIFSLALNASELKDIDHQIFADGSVVLGQEDAKITAAESSDAVNLNQDKNMLDDTEAVSNVPELGQLDYTDEKLSNMRKMIAKSMHSSLSSMAQLTHTSSFDATRILAYRKELKASMEKTGIPNITLNDMIMFAVSRVLLKHPDLNAHFLGDSIRRFRHVHLGMAVDTPRGLMVPTIRNADTMSLGQLAVRSKALATQAQQGNIDPDDLSGASFTISNLGALGIEHFTPVINPPQTGILGVNNITERVRTVDGQITTYNAMGLSLTYDHRALDGAPASRFLQDLCSALENFTALLV